MRKPRKLKLATVLANHGLESVKPIYADFIYLLSKEYAKYRNELEANGEYPKKTHNCNETLIKNRKGKYVPNMEELNYYSKYLENKNVMHLFEFAKNERVAKALDIYLTAKKQKEMNPELFKSVESVRRQIVRPKQTEPLKKGKKKEDYKPEPPIQFVEAVKQKVIHESITYKTMTITPEMAAEMLRHNKSNRPISKKNVEVLFNEIKAGRWKQNGENITFDKYGNLVNGQHRLLAIIKAGIPITTGVCYGVESDSFFTMDSGKNRTNGDALGIIGVKRSTPIATAIALIVEFDKFYLFNRVANGTDKRKAISKESIIKFYKDNEDEIEDCMDYAVGMMKDSDNKYYSKAEVCAMYFILKKSDEHVADLLFNRLCAGVDMSYSSPVRVLRRKFNNLPKGAKIDRHTKIALMVKVFNAMVSDSSLKKLGFVKGKSKFPKLIGYKAA